MPAIKATDQIIYVGVQDPTLRVFDVIVYTEYGTSYNSYIVQGRDKTVLFETVKDRFYDEFIANVKEAIDPGKIDYIVVSHTEPDHTGALAKTLALAKNATVVCSPSAAMFLKEILNEEFKVHAVKDGESIDIGGLTMQFMLLPMLHWPDTMLTYMPELKALFTCDFLGCHYSDPHVFNDLMNDDFAGAYRHYFNSIMAPYCDPYVKNALARIEPLEISFIGNGHGPVLRKDIDKYVGIYKELACGEKREAPRAAVVFASAYGYTAALADAIIEGIREEGISDVNRFDLVKDDKQAAAEAVRDADGFLLGSSTIVADALPPVYEMLLGLNPVVHKGRVAGAFGSYGWSGEAIGNLIVRMKQLRLNVVGEGYKARFKPSAEQLDGAREYGREFARALRR
ncbi:MAG: FprA family A-type flavoprotein [Bacillota bacterium]